MIEIEQLAKYIQEKLNVAVNTYNLNKFIPNSTFEFNICLNSGEYKKATTERTSNSVTFYINAIMKALSSDVEGIEDIAETYNATMSTSIEFLIPFPEKKRLLDDGSAEKFSDAVHHLISSVLQAGLSTEMTDLKENSYLVGSRFSIPSPGAKEIRSMTGESLPLTIYSTHYFVAQGINSDKIELYIGTERVYASRIGIARRSITDGNIFSEDSASKNTVGGTALTITFDAPKRPSAYDTAITNYLLYGDLYVMNVYLKIPCLDYDGAKTIKEHNYRMVFADIGLNAETNLAASNNVRLIEYFEETQNG